MKYKCIKSVNNGEGIDANGDLVMRRSFTKDEIYDYYGNGVMNNNFNQPHQVRWWFRLWHFRKLNASERVNYLAMKMQYLQGMIAQSGIDEQKFDPISRVSSEIYVELVYLQFDV